MHENVKKVPRYVYAVFFMIRCIFTVFILVWGLKLLRTGSFRICTSPGVWAKIDIENHAFETHSKRVQNRKNRKNRNMEADDDRPGYDKRTEPAGGGRTL